ncbi:YihY/virulence factor BrkB family protein [Chitinimonas lacunae]|uniref:YihY/virulence factor BrkB family protein n=1 Tax=Chitinimonas lacunae TaxID=1963018 RepID=A0ABV8MSZ9_9NEIS
MKTTPSSSSLGTWWHMCRAAASAWIDDYAPSMGAALAYYTVFSLAPLLLIVISVAGLVFGAEVARDAILTEMRMLIGMQGAQAVETLLSSVSKPAESTAATLVGVVVLLIGATTVFAELQDALDRIWRVARPDNRSGVWSLLRTRLLSFGMILGIGFLLIVSLVASAALAMLEKWWAPWFGEWLKVAQVVNFLLSFGLITTVFAMIYKIMPRVRISWRDVWLGALVTALLFTIGKAFIGWYIGTSGVASGYGAAGSLIVLLLWVYYSAQIFLLGAEFTWIYAHQFGSFRQLEPVRVVKPMAEVTPLPGNLGGVEHRGQILQPPLGMG